MAVQWAPSTGPPAIQPPNALGAALHNTAVPAGAAAATAAQAAAVAHLYADAGGGGSSSGGGGGGDVACGSWLLAVADDVDCALMGVAPGAAGGEEPQVRKDWEQDGKARPGGGGGDEQFCQS